MAQVVSAIELTVNGERQRVHVDPQVPVRAPRAAAA